MNGMDMLFKSLGVNPEDITKTLTGLFNMASEINASQARIEASLARIEARLGTAPEQEPGGARFTVIEGTKNG